MEWKFGCLLIVSGENGRSTHVDQDVQWQYAGAHAPAALANSKTLVLIALQSAF